VSKAGRAQAVPAGAAVPAATPVSPPNRASGVTPEVLVVATVLALPAFWTSIVLHELPAHVLLERYVIVLFGVLLISEPLYWFGVGGRLAPPREFDPEEGHRVPRREALQPTDVRHASLFDDDDFGQREVDEWGTPLFPGDDLDAPPAFDESDLNAPGALGQPFEAAPVFDDVLGPLEFDDPADLARPNFD